MAITVERLPGGLRRHAFLPLAFRLSLAVEQADWAEFNEDPALAASVLRNGYKVVKADGCVTWFDTALEAEAAGASIVRDALGRVIADPVLAADPGAEELAHSPVFEFLGELTNRVVRESARHSAVLGYLTGQRTLLRMLFGALKRDEVLDAAAAGPVQGTSLDLLETATQISMRFAKMYGEAGVSALLVAEQDDVTSACVGPFEGVINIAHYYNLPIVLVCRQPINASLRPAIQQRGINYLVEPAIEADELLVAIPQELFGDVSAAEKHRFREQAQRMGGHRVFVSAWEIPSDVPPERVTSLRDVLLSDGST